MSEFNDETRSRLLAPMEVDQDPAGSTPKIKVDDTWHEAVWLGSPVQKRVNGKFRWAQTARSIQFFAGPAVTDPDGAIVLQLGDHPTETGVTFSTGDFVAKASSMLEVTAT